MPSSRIPLIFGTAAFGKENTHATRIHDISVCQEIIDVFVKEHSYKELDCARRYGLGTSEEYLSQLNLHGARVDTKAIPPFKLEDLQSSVEASAKALGTVKPRVFYFHGPDRNTPYEESCAAVNEMYKAGHFEQFGLSNHYAWEVAIIHTICKERGYVLPTVYQGMYNLLGRGVETELFACLRKLNIRFTAFSPLAGGLLAGNLKSKDDPGTPGGRYDPNTERGKAARGHYASGTQFEALAILEEVAAKHNITLAEIGLRWIQHHSKMVPEDGVIIGASSVKQLRDNIKFSELGPLPKDVVKACDEAWIIAKPNVPLYPS